MTHPQLPLDAPACAARELSPEMDIAWLDGLLNKESFRPENTAVASIDIGDVRCAVATNGHGLIIVASADGPDAEFEHAATVKSWIRELCAVERPIPFAKLVQWIGDIGPDSTPCGECRNGKWICDVCDEVHACCEKCGGTGRRFAPNAHGLVSGIPIDRRLVRRFLGPLTAETVQVAAVPGDNVETMLPVMVRSPGAWLLLVMPMMDGEGPELLDGAA